jgi:hypothetical protein
MEIESLKVDPDTEAAVMSVLNRLNEATARRDFASVLELFGTDPDILLIGSQADEVAVGPSELKAFLERAFASQPPAYRFEWRSYSVSGAGSVCWVAIDASIHTSGMVVPYRVTAVLEKRDNRWFLMQYHGSEPTRGQAKEKAE